MMPFEKLTQTNIIDPAKRVYDSVSRAPLTSMPQTLLADVVKEGALLPLRNLSMIMNWTGKSMMKVLGSTLKTSLLAASLIPLPMPGGKNTFVAEIRRSGSDIREAFREKVSGNPESFRDLVQKLKTVRQKTEHQAMHTLAS